MINFCFEVKCLNCLERSTEGDALDVKEAESGEEIKAIISKDRIC